MFNPGYGNSGDFEALARQYWSAWGDAMRQGGMGAAAPPPPANNWQQAVDWWSQLLPRAPSQANDALGRFSQQARDWYGQMQQVAAQFAGRDSQAAEIGQAWRQALGAQGANPFPEMFKAMSSKGLHGLDDWMEQAKPWLDNLRQESQRWLHLPAFGQHREQQERLQALAQAQLDYQQHSTAFNGLMGKCAQRAFSVFEDKLVAHEEPGRQLTSARALFDLWIDAAEQAYAEIALSQEFRQLYGAQTNAQMRLRSGVQREIELMSAQFGMPTRTEIDSAHRKIAELERALRRAAAAETRPARARPAPTRQASPRPSSTRPNIVSPAESIDDTAVRRVSKRPAKRASRKPSATKAANSRSRSTARSKPAPSKPAPSKPVPRKAAARKRAPSPATVAQRPKSKKAASPAPAKAPVARKPAAKRAKKPESRNKAPVVDKPVVQPTKASALAAKSTGGRVVSMKDWVARYSAAETPAKGRKGARK